MIKKFGKLFYDKEEGGNFMKKRIENQNKKVKVVIHSGNLRIYDLLQEILLKQAKSIF